MTVPANDAGEKLANVNSHPVTIGTMDSVLAYIQAHLGDDPSAAGAGAGTGDVGAASLAKAEADMLHLQTLLLKQSDDIESQQQARQLQACTEQWRHRTDSQPAKTTRVRWTSSLFAPCEAEQV
jgi:hypothetical protein